MPSEFHIERRGGGFMIRDAEGRPLHDAVFATEAAAEGMIVRFTRDHDILPYRVVYPRR